MKLAACYTIFNGLELLQASINQIKTEVDEIILCFQDISNTGQYSSEISAAIRHFSSRLGYQILFFAPDLALNTKQNEINKHNLILKHARKIGCTHFFLSATDHFYEKKHFISAKKQVIEGDFDMSFTKMYTYYKHPTWQITPIEDYYMPFICKISTDTRYERVNFRLRTDPSVMLSTHKTFKEFSIEEFPMHHYSMIRQDIQNKFNNAAASIRWTAEQKKLFLEEYLNYDLKSNKGISYFGGRTIKMVPDYFKLQ